MNNWLRNIQGQITELASEVLQEATTEVPDPESELQVERKKCSEAEILLINKNSQYEELEKRFNELQEQLYTANLENDAVCEKFERMIADRDLQIKNLQNESNNAQFNTKNFALTKSSSDSSNVQNQKIAQEIIQLKEKHEAEISALMTVHSDNIQHIRQEYEYEIADLQRWNTADASHYDDEKAAVHEREITELKNVLEAVHAENQKTIAGLKSQLLEKETEIHKIQECFPSNEDDEKRPPSLAGTDSAGSNSGWERMGTEYVSGETRVGASSNSSNYSASGDNTITTKSDKKTDLDEINSDNQPKLKLLQKELEKAKLEIESNKSLIKKITEELEEKKMLCDKFENLIEENNKKIKNSQNDSINSQNYSLNNINELEKKITNLNERSNLLNTKCEEYEVNISNITKKLSISSSSVSSLQDLNNNLLKQIESLNVALVEANEKLSDYSRRYELLLHERDDERLIHQDTLEKSSLLEQEILKLKSNTNINSDDQAQSKFMHKELEKAKLEIESNKSLIKKITEELEEKKMLCDKFENLIEANNKKIKNSQNDSSNEIIELENKVFELQKTSDELKAKCYEYETNISSLCEELSISSSSVSSLQDSNNNLLKQIESLNVALVEANEKLSDYSRRYELLLHERDELNLQYQETLKNGSLLEQEILQLKSNAILSIETANKNKDELDHTVKELNRLREHLLSMEEVSIKEAIIAEERETQLRDEIKILQNKTQVFSESANQSQNQYKEEVSLLKDQLVASEENSAKLRSLLEEKDRSCHDLTKALSNLQKVLSELGEDHTEEVKSLEVQNKLLKTQKEELATSLEKLCEEHSSLIEDKRYFEDSVTLLKEDLVRKNTLIEELENQVEEYRHNDDSISQTKSSSTYKIDDTTLKELFFSYFIAEKEKQPEIAFVMSSILGYPPEKQTIIHEAINASQNSRGWFGFGGRKNVASRTETSLTEQFIRFLESESRELSEQPTLSIRSEQALSGTNLTISDVTQLPAVESISSRTYSTSDLKSILDS